eukprot:gnl/TRDRNA2_/TRDRNA2_188111_c0_seq1.p1 gnl/TRDRNA2_/TRDRNA2_188111_c0~~gnl/TRDRNA2_/TRDRNA2_188111_c0_seq1.p1  ORF type:complete len:326 (-),score=55.72 gnl/TRDRNA2_/TRDRNA2_188111_c0_seq1:125-1102(-)
MPLHRAVLPLLRHRLLSNSGSSYVSPCSSLWGAQRFLRERPRVSKAAQKIFTIDNPVTAKNWPPMKDVGDPMTPKKCRDIMHHLNVQEMAKMREQRVFPMPKISPGDMVEVKYELSRSQQTMAVFQGFCVEVRNKWLNSSFVLKNTYDGVGVEQLIPRYSPRLLSVRVLRAIARRDPVIDKRPPTRNYRHLWHYYVRGKYGRGKRALWRHQTPQKAGIMSLEPRIRRELANIRARYQMRRAEAKLPPYIFPGPYHVTRRQTREVKAELYRRMLIYAWDERQMRAEKKRRLKEKHKWGVYKINKEPKSTALTELPSYHPLKENLPK